MALDRARLFTEAQLANRAESQFLATMRHGIRTRIDAVTGYADRMGAGIARALTPPQQEYLPRIRESSHHLLALVNDIMDLSQVEAGEMQVRRERVMLREVVGQEVPPEPGDDVSALEVLHRLLTQGEAVSLARFRRERR